MNAEIAATPSLDELLAARGSATPAELGLAPAQVIALAKKRPELEPVFLVRFRSRQGKVRVEEVRAYAWPSQQLALRHLGYQAEEQRLLRLEPRQPVPFPQRLYTRFQDQPKVLEELRVLEKSYTRAVKQAPSKPGRCEMDLTPLQVPFKKLGDDVVLEMWIDAASVFQRLDNQSYAGKMLGNLLKVAEKSKVEPSLLARTVLSAADDGVFNTKLYEYTWAQLQKRSIQAALGFGLRVFRRLMSSGRPLPTDFVKDLRKGALAGKVKDFEALYDSTVLWAAGLASFWNTARKSSSWRSEATADHKETSLLRERLVELWVEASKHSDGEAWKSELWQRLRDVNPELTVYGRLLVVEKLMAAFEQSGGASASDDEKLLQATLALLTKSPSPADRARVEDSALKALTHLARQQPQLLWGSQAAIEEALRSASGQLTGFVALCDLLSDVSELLGEREGRTLLSSLAGYTSAWTAALVSALGAKKKDDDDDGDSDALPIVSLVGEALGRYTPETAPEQLVELGPLIAARLARDLSRGRNLTAWERVLGTLRQLGPIGEGIAHDATARFIESDGLSADFRHAAPLAHLLDQQSLREVAEARFIVDEALEKTTSVAPPCKEFAFPVPDGFDAGSTMRGTSAASGKGYDVLFTSDGGDDDKPRPLVLAHLDFQGVLSQHGAGKAIYDNATLWVHPDGLRVISAKGRIAQVFDAKFKSLKKFEVEEDFGGNAYTDLNVMAYGQYLMLSRAGAALLIDHQLEIVGECTAGQRYGTWYLLEGPKGAGPMAVYTAYESLDIFTAPGQKAPPLKPPGGGEVQFVGRLSEGSVFADFVDKKGARRRARLDQASFAWRFEDVSADLEVLDVVGLKTSVSSGISGADRLGFAVDLDGERAAFFDWAGRPLASLRGSNGVPTAVNVTEGNALFTLAVAADPSLPARLVAAPELRGALTRQAAEALPRSMYADHEALAAHLLAELGKRSSAAKALELLGPFAAPLFGAVAASLGEVLEARAAVLDARPRPVQRVPGRVPGVPRTEVRRAIREHFQGDELTFWALDARDPGPFVQQFVSNGQVDLEAFSTARKLLRLAQDPRTSMGIAERAVEAAEAIANAIQDPSLELVLDLSGAECAEQPAKFGGGGAPFVFPNRGSYAKKAAPMALVEREASREPLAAWISASLLGGLAPQRVRWLQEDSRTTLLTTDYESVQRFAAAVVFEGRSFEIFVAARRSADGLEWWLDGFKGQAPGAVWSALCKAVEQCLHACQAKNGSPVWPTADVRTENVQALVEGVAFTRARLGQRERLSPAAWPAPPQQGALAHLDERQRLWVVLAWVVGRLHAKQLGTSEQAFEAVAKQCKAVEKQYYGLCPKQGDKSEDEVELTERFVALRVNSLFGSDLEDLLVLKDPAELVLEFATEAGLLGADAGKKRSQ